MKKIEAKTLEAAYEEAAKELNCSVADLQYEIVQYPSSGFLGLGAKKAIIVAACGKTNEPQTRKVADTAPVTPRDAKDTKRTVTENRPADDTGPTSTEDEILNGFFDNSESGTQGKHVKETKTEQTYIDEKELGKEIEKELKALLDSTCFDIDVVETDVIDGTAYIFIDGEDAALLIGKEGYRYNALSYLLYNWIHNQYGLFIKLEIAQFLASQQEMIRNYIQPVVDHIYKEGWGKTRPLDGILVQIALEQLREEFPGKYVAIKRTREGQRYILVNEFNKRP